MIFLLERWYMMKIEKQVQLKDWTTLHIGGPATYMAHPETESEILEVLEMAKEKDLPLYILGNGSNVLFEDEGYEGIILHLGEQFSAIKRLENNQVWVQSGATNAQLASFCIENSLGGYEFASGIPGTIGGAIVMNAGAYDGEMKDVLVSIEYIDEEGKLQTKMNEELDLSYRHSIFSNTFGIVTSAIYQFEPKESSLVAEKIADLKERRYSKQPMEEYSAGSTFKRPEGHYASALIHQGELQGYHVGDAEVSMKHAGFLINKGNASSKEFNQLIADVQRIVLEKFNVQLEPEVRRVKSKHEK